MTNVLHWSFDTERFSEVVLPRCFAAAESTLPDSAFDPDGDWESTYDIVYMNSLGAIENLCTTYYGEISLKHKKESNGRSRFVVDVRKQTAQDRAKEVHATHAEFVCADDALATLAFDDDGGGGWHVACEVKNLGDAAVEPYVKHDQYGRYRRIDETKAVIEKSRDNNVFTLFAETSPATPLSTDWGLMHAVQRLKWHESAAPPASFNMLHGLEKLHRNQTLGFLESFEATFGTRPIKLHGYYHIGEGMMPACYWVTDDGRLLLARFSMMAYVYRNR